MNRSSSRSRRGYMLIVVLVFGILMTAFGAVLFYPTHREISYARSLEARTLAGQAVRSAFELATDELEDGRKGGGSLGRARYEYEVSRLDEGKFRVRARALASAGNYEEEALLDAVAARGGDADMVVVSEWRLTHRRARE